MTPFAFGSQLMVQYETALQNSLNFDGGYAKLPSIVTTMLGQAKTIIQAEIDSARELINIFRFNCVFAKEHRSYWPIYKDPATALNLLRYGPLRVSSHPSPPFHFTTIAGNLSTPPSSSAAPAVSCPSAA